MQDSLLEKLGRRGNQSLCAGPRCFVPRRFRINGLGSPRWPVRYCEDEEGGAQPAGPAAYGQRWLSWEY